MVENFINKKSKAFVVFLFAVSSLVILAFSTKIAVVLCNKWNGLIIAGCIMLFASVLHLLARKRRFLYIFSFLANCIGCGFSVSAYYLTRNISVKLSEMILAAIPAAAILFLIYSMLQKFSKSKAITLSIAVSINIVLLAGSVVFWIRKNEPCFSFGFFCLVVSLYFIWVFGVTINHDDRFVLRDISYGSFGSFLILTVVVIAILSEGDILDMGDLGIGGNGKKRRKQKKS